MIHFFYENIDENIDENLKNWIENIIITEGKKLGEINYIFCDDEYLLKINQNTAVKKDWYEYQNVLLIKDLGLLWQDKKA